MTTNKYAWLVNIALFLWSALIHIFEGILRRGIAYGYHSEAIPDTPGRIIPGTDSQPNNHGAYKAKVMVSGVPKRSNGGYSTFFPKLWSPQEVVDAINEAYHNKVPDGGNAYRGENCSGMPIILVIDEVGKIISAYPVYKSPLEERLAFSGKSSVSSRTRALPLPGKSKEVSMKYPYYIEYIDPESPIMRLPTEIELVTWFLFYEVEDVMGRDSRLEEIDLVLQGEEPSIGVGGNAYGLLIHKDFTTVMFGLAEDENDPANECLIETEELKKLILVWLDLKRCICHARYLRETMRERHTDPAIAVPVLPVQSAKRYAPPERKEELLVALV